MNNESKQGELETILVQQLSHLMRAHREARGYSIRTLARKLKMSRRSIKAWESGRRCPPGPMMIALIEHYGQDARLQLQQLHFDLQLSHRRTNLD